MLYVGNICHRMKTRPVFKNESRFSRIKSSKIATSLLRYKSPKAYMAVQLLLDAFSWTLEQCLFWIFEISWRPREISYRSTKMNDMTWQILKANKNLDYFNDDKQIIYYNSYEKIATNHLLKLQKCLKSVVFRSRKKLSSLWLVWNESSHQAKTYMNKSSRLC